MGKNNSDVRAKKVQSSSTKIDNSKTKKLDKKISKKISKSPILIVPIIFLAIGLCVGVFLTKSFCSFEMREFVVEGYSSEEIDYVEIDLQSKKESLILSDNYVSMDELYNNFEIIDGGAELKIFGMDFSGEIKTKYYYREDISHDCIEVSDIDLRTPGVYYIEYTTSNILFKNNVLIRTIIVLGVEEDG